MCWHTYTTGTRYQSIYNPTDEWILPVTQNRVKEPGVKCTDTVSDKEPAKACQWDVQMPGLNPIPYGGTYISDYGVFSCKNVILLFEFSYYGVT